MNVRELMNFLIGLDPELHVCIDVDDGVKKSYVDILTVRVANGGLETFVALDADYAEVDSDKRV